MNLSVFDIENQWKSFVLEAGLDGAVCISASQFDLGRRVYLHNNKIFKVAIFGLDPTSKARANDLLGEGEILKILEKMPYTPRQISYKRLDEGEVLGIERINGSNWANIRLGIGRNLVITFKIYLALLSCSWHGVAHNDVKPENIIVDNMGRVYLIDFDQAKMTSRVTAITSNLLGISINNNVAQVNTMKSLLIKILPGRFYSFLQRHFGRASKELLQMRQLPTLPEDASASLVSIMEAWKLAKKSDANAPGGGVAYYSIDFEGVRFPGERPWEERWNIFKTADDYDGKKIVELGCNMGLLSCFLIKYMGAIDSVGVDCDKRILKSASLVAKSFDVDMQLKKIDFDSEVGWEADLIEYAPDIVFALSVLNWVEDKERFLKFVSNFSTLIIEGHDAMDVEVERLKKFGFSDFKLLSISERNRPVIKCTK